MRAIPFTRSLMVCVWLQIVLVNMLPAGQASNGPGQFRDPRPVEIKALPIGSGGTPISTEEPFLSRDGRFLMFNTGHNEGHKDLHFAESIDGSWVYKGPMGPSVNTPKHVEGNPTMDSEYTVYFIDTGVRAMVRSGRFLPNEGELVDLRIVDGLPDREVKLLAQRFYGTMGVEVSANGRIVFFSRASWKMRGVKLGPIISSDLLLATRKGDGLVFDKAEAARIMQAVNSTDLEYAASVSKDGHELFFTRLDAASVTRGKPRSRIMRTQRDSVSRPFGPPEMIAAIGSNDFVEGPAISADGKALFYHKRVKDKFRLYRVIRD